RWGVLACSLALVAGSAVPSGAAGQAPPEWRAEPVWRVASDALDAMMVSGAALAPDGTAWVLDGLSPALVLVDAAGTIVRRIDRQGSGPGEFTGPLVGPALSDGVVWVYDTGQGMWSGFGPDGSLVESHRESLTMEIPMRLVGLEGGGVAFEVSDFDGARTLAVRDGPAGAERFERVIGRADILTLIPGVAATPLWTVRGGDLVVGSNQTYRFSVLDARGAEQGSVGRADTGRLPLDGELRQALRKSVIDRQVGPGGTLPPELEEMLVFPDSLPVVDALLPGPDGGLITVRGLGLRDGVTPEGSDPLDPDRPTRLDVFDASGAWVGTVSLPPGFVPMAARGALVVGAFPSDLFDVDIAAFRLRAP
ncbi:MAG: hypothetical protein D6701_01755, partial [Gemmatimonadetes bacterium]